MSIASIGLKEKALGPYRPLEVKHHSQVTVRAYGAADSGQHLIVGCRLAKRLRQAGPTQVHHHAVRIGQREYRVLDRLADVEHKPRLVRRLPHAQVLHLHRVRVCSHSQQKKNDGADKPHRCRSPEPNP
jgi:hypothetical protein